MRRGRELHRNALALEVADFADHAVVVRHQGIAFCSEFPGKDDGGAHEIGESGGPIMASHCLPSSVTAHGALAEIGFVPVVGNGLAECLRQRLADLDIETRLGRIVARERQVCRVGTEAEGLSLGRAAWSSRCDQRGGEAENSCTGEGMASAMTSLSIPERVGRILGLLVVGLARVE